MSSTLFALHTQLGYKRHVCLSITLRWLNKNNSDGRILNHEQDYKTYVHDLWMIEILYETVLVNF